jgi:hypothetical protein
MTSFPTSQTTDQTPERIAAFEPCRAAVRPLACDERMGCWVKVGPPGCSTNGGYRVKCLACGGRILFAGRAVAHQRALVACCSTVAAP